MLLSALSGLGFKGCASGGSAWALGASKGRVYTRLGVSWQHTERTTSVQNVYIGIPWRCFWVLETSGAIPRANDLSTVSSQGLAPPSRDTDPFKRAHLRLTGQSIKDEESLDKVEHPTIPLCTLLQMYSWPEPC